MKRNKQSTVILDRNPRHSLNDLHSVEAIRAGRNLFGEDGEDRPNSTSFPGSSSSCPPEREREDPGDEVAPQTIVSTPYFQL